MSRFVGLCSCGRQYHAATEPALRRDIKYALDSGHDVTVWQFSYGLAGNKRSTPSDAEISTATSTPSAPLTNREDAEL